jgi:4-amino-4-deoxy-L-arabinose transferase-like glycosyltransferase
VVEAILGEGRGTILPVRARIFFLLILCTLTFFAGLGRPAITDSDEAFYAEAGREMVESGDYLTPRFGYEPRFQKPILFYWLIAASYQVAGVSEAAARFSAAMAGLGIVLLSYAAARRWYDTETAFLAGLIAATSFGCFVWARLALPDLPLAFFVTLATWAAIVALEDGRTEVSRDGDSRRDGGKPGTLAWWLASAVASALAFLTKGPIGVVLPAIVVAGLVCAKWIRGRRSLRSVGIRPAHLALAALIFVILAAPWYVEM